jgi:YD repeat-containing protein
MKIIFILSIIIIITLNSCTMEYPTYYCRGNDTVYPINHETVNELGQRIIHTTGTVIAVTYDEQGRVIQDTFSNGSAYVYTYQGDDIIITYIDRV